MRKRGARSIERFFSQLLGNQKNFYQNIFKAFI